MRSDSVAFGVLVLASATLLACNTDDPAGPTPALFKQTPVAAQPWRVVFESTRDGQFEVYVVNPDGTGLANLTQNPADDVDPVLSPDHSKVAFASDRVDDNLDIYVAKVNGTEVTRLTTAFGSDFAPKWSPDGTRIAFLHNLTLHVVNADGTGELDLGSFWGRPVSWSPDGQLIATEAGPDIWDRDIWAVQADGAGATDLTPGTPPELEPAWSPRGNRVAFTRRTVVDRDLGLFHDDVWVVNAHGHGERQLTHSEFSSTELSVGASRPAWSPDARLILFESDTPGSPTDLYTVRPNGKGLTNLTDTEDAAESFATWSPDGSQIVFRKIAGTAQPDVFIMNADGSGLINLSNDPGFDQP
jgi:Tol biopolymer transport system component